MIGEKELYTADMAYFSLDGATVHLEYTSLAKILVMAGKPL